MYYQYYILLALLPFVAPLKQQGWWAFVAVLAGVAPSAVGAFCALTGGPVPMWAVTMDWVAGLFALLFNFVFLAVMPYVAKAGRVDGAGRSAVSLHYATLVVLFYALQGVLASESRYNFLFYWELMSIALFFLVSFRSHKREIMHAAVSLLVVMHAGFFVLLGAFAAMGVGESSDLFGVGTMSLGLWLLFAVGFMLKSALFPFHFWLLSAYRSAPWWVSALMGGAVTNIGVYGLIRLMMVVQNMEVCALVLMGLGAAGALYGAFRLTSSHSLGKVLSNSSIENIGLIVLSLGFGFYSKSLGHSELAFYGFLGGVLQLVFHAVAKTLLFLSAGAVVEQTNDDNASALGGLVHTMPRTSLFFGLGVFSLMGLVPLAGFFSEFMIFSTFFSGVNVGLEPIIGVIGILVVGLVAALSIFSLTRSFSIAFLGTGRSVVDRVPSERLSRGEWFSYSLLSLVLLVGGVLSWFATHIIGRLFALNTVDFQVLVDQSFIGLGVSVGLVVVLIVGLLLLRHHLLSKRVQSVEPTWACGQGEPAPCEQYTDESFAREAGLTFSIPGQKGAAHNVARRFVPVNVMRRLTGRLAFLQTGRVSHYIMHIVLFLILILILTVTGVL